MTKLLFAVFAAGFALIGCGGGGQEVAISAPAPLPAAPVVVPDVTFTQISTVESVTPGETFRPVLIAVTCPLRKDGGSCEKTLPLGEVGFTSDLALQDVKFLHDGFEIMGFVSQEGNLYRFNPTGYSPIWQPGIIEVVATLSSSALDGATTSIAVQATDASIDKTLSVVSSETMVAVKALAYNAPAAIMPTKDGLGFSYSCPSSVSMGCKIESFNATVNGVSPGSEVQLFVASMSWNWWADSNGSISSVVGIGYTVQPGETVSVQVLSKQGQFGAASVWFFDFKSYSGDKLITPVAPSFCTSVSSQYCKG